MTQTQAIFSAFFAFFLWVGLDVCMKMAAQEGMSPFMFMFLFGLIATLGIAVAATPRNGMNVHAPHPWKELGILSLGGIMIVYTNILALKHLPLTVFYILVFTTPLIVAVASSYLKHEILTSKKISCLIAGFLGTVLALWSRDWGHGGEGVGYIAVIFSNVSFTICILLTRKMSQTCTTEIIQMANAWPIAAAGLIGVALQGAPLPPTHSIVFAIAAGFISLVANIFYIKALKNTASTNVAQMQYTQIVSGAIVGYLIWDEIPTWNLIVGSMVIITSGIIVALESELPGSHN